MTATTNEHGIYVTSKDLDNLRDIADPKINMLQVREYKIMISMSQKRYLKGTLK